LQVVDFYEKRLIISVKKIAALRRMENIIFIYVFSPQNLNFEESCGFRLWV